MNNRKTIRAMKDKNFRAQLSTREQRLLGPGPSGIVELDDRLLKAVGGGSVANCSTIGGQTTCVACQR